MFVLKIILTSVISLITLFLIAKLLGRRQIAELSVFDYINGITLGSIAAELATCDLSELLRPFTAMVVYGCLTLLIALMSDKSLKARAFISGVPVVVMSGNRLYRESLKKLNIDINEFLVMCRNTGYFDISQIDTAIFETNGKLSILPKKTYTPVTPDDMKLPVAPVETVYCVIIDGKISESGITRAKLTEEQLKGKLKDENAPAAEDIFYAFVTSSGRLVYYPKNV